MLNALSILCFALGMIAGVVVGPGPTSSRIALYLTPYLIGAGLSLLALRKRPSQRLPWLLLVLHVVGIVLAAVDMPLPFNQPFR